jgi:nucleotide-binding universal stress UspA family protein
MAERTVRGTLGDVHVATDFSDGALIALERGVRLPLRLGASLELVHVLPEEGTPGPHADEAAAKTRLEALRGAVAERFQAAGNETRDLLVSVKHGNPFAEIVRNAHHGRAELIVLGRHGERTFRDLIIGSTAERVIRKGDVSVLVVAKRAEGIYRKPLVALDMSDSSRFALELAVRLMGTGSEMIDVVHVAPRSESAFGEAALVLDHERRADEARRVRAEVSEFLERAGVGHRCNLLLRTGDARREILDVVKGRDSDLVALGTEGRTGLGHIRVGSVAEGVLRSAACDVLVARLPRTDVRLP